MPNVSFKLYARVYETVAGTYSWEELKYTSGVARDLKFGDISTAMENPEMPAHFWSQMDSIQVADDDNYFGNLASANQGLINTGDPTWQDWHYRPIKVEILDEAGTVLDSIVAAIDDIIPQEGSPWAQIKLIGLGQRSAEMAADGERAWGTSGGSAIDLFGDWTGATNPHLYQSRTKSNTDGSIVKTWYKYKDAFDLLSKTCYALGDDKIATPSITRYDIDTADSRRIVSMMHRPQDYISDAYYTAMCFVRYSGVDYLFLGARTKLYKINLSTMTYTLVVTNSDGYYIHHIFFNDNAGVNKVYAVALQNTTDEFAHAAIHQYDLATGGLIYKALTGLYGTTHVKVGSQAAFKRGFFAFKKTGGTSSNGAIYFQSYFDTVYADRANGTAYIIGDKVKGVTTDYDYPGQYGDLWHYLECVIAGTSDASFLTITLPKQHDDTVVDGTVTWKIKYRVAIEARNCYDIDGASWATDLIGAIYPTMQTISNGSPANTIRAQHGVVLATTSPVVEDFYIAMGINSAFSSYIQHGQLSGSTWTWTKLTDNAEPIIDMCVLSTKVIYSLCGEPYSGYYQSLLKSIDLDGTDDATLEDRPGESLFRTGFVKAPDGRCYYFRNGENAIASTDGSTTRQENWLFDPGGGVSGPAIPAFEMADNAIWSGTFTTGCPTVLTSGVALTLDDQTDWRLFGISQVIDQCFYCYSKKDYGCIDFCNWDGMSVADIRDMIAKRLGGIWYYDKTGAFIFNRRIPTSASVYDFAEGQALVKMVGSGRDKIQNRYVFTPRMITAKSCEITQVPVQKDASSTLEIQSSGIIISSGCTENALWKVSFENGADLTAYKIYKWNSGTSAWDYKVTGDRDSVYQYSYITLNPDAFTGTAVVYDSFTFYTTPMTYEYAEMTYVDRTEVENTASISLYGVREHSVSENYIKRIHSFDILYKWLQQTKDPHPSYTIKFPKELVTLAMNDVITLTAAKYGLTSAKKHKVINIKQTATLGQAVTEATVVDINIS